MKFRHESFLTLEVPISGSLYEGFYYCGSILVDPCFWKLPHVCTFASPVEVKLDNYQRRDACEICGKGKEELPVAPRSLLGKVR